MKVVRVYLAVDITVENENEVLETVQRIMSEGEPYVGEGGFEITSYEVLDDGFNDEVVTLTVHNEVNDECMSVTLPRGEAIQAIADAVDARTDYIQAMTLNKVKYYYGLPSGGDKVDSRTVKAILALLDNM